MRYCSTAATQDRLLPFFLPMITVFFLPKHEVVLPLKMGNHLYLPMRQVGSGCGKRGKNIDNM